MAIYHLSMKIISRGNGQNAVASAAYRSGEELIDEQDGTTKFYDRNVLPETHILAPPNVPNWVYERQTLWNEVERSETRVNSRLARELEIALPLELSNEQQTELLKEFIQENCVNKGMVADIGIHRDHPENPHAHIMLTTREIGKNGFGEKNRSWNSVEYLEHTRKCWAEVCNKYLEKANSMERIDHRSYKDQGVDLIPTEHEGVIRNKARREGNENDYAVIRRNNIAKAYNEKVISLQEKRDQLLNEGLSETTDRPENLVVTYRMYMTNQRELRIAYNKINFYKSKLKKEGTLSLFEREQLANARQKVKDIGDLKFDYLKNVDNFLNGNSSIFVSFADKYGESQAEKLKKKLLESGKEIDRDTQKYIDRSAKRFSEEMKIRFADSIKQLNTNNAKTIVAHVEKQLHTNTAKRIIKGWINHENVTLAIRELKAELEDYKQAGNKVDKKMLKLINNLATLENVKLFYETQALSTLKSQGFEELADKYNTEKTQSVIVSMYDELVKDTTIKSPSVLEARTFNNFKLRRVQNIVRGELSGVNIQRRLDSLEQWKSIQERSIEKLEKLELSSENIEKLEKKKEGLKETKQSIQLLKEGKNILNARATAYLDKNPSLKIKLHAIEFSSSDKMDLDFKKEANYHLFIEQNINHDPKEVLTKMYDNILDYKEYQVEHESKNVLYRHEHSSYRAILGNLDESNRKLEELKEGIEAAREKVYCHEKILQQFEDKWELKKELEASKFMLGKSAKIKEVDMWLEKNGVTAHTKSGALNQLKYQYNQASYQVTKYNELDQVKIPALNNMKYITENKAIRTVEKDFKLTAGFEYKIELSEQQRETFIAYMEAKRTLGADHLKTQQIEQKLSVYTEQFRQAKNELQSTEKLLAEKQNALRNFEKSTKRRLSRFEETLNNKAPNEMNQSKEQINTLKTFRKTEVSRMEAQIKELKIQEKAQREKAQQKAQLIKVGSSFKNLLNEYTSQVSEAEISKARKLRMKSLEKESSLELELKKER